MFEGRAKNKEYNPVGSLIDKIKLNLSLYVRTLRAIYSGRHDLLTSEQGSSSEEGTIQARVMLPFRFFASSLAASTAFEKVVWPNPPPFELPPELTRLEALLDLIPESSVSISILIVAVQVILPFLFLKMMRKPVRFSRMLNAYFYVVSAFLHIPNIVFCIAMYVFGNNLGYSRWFEYGGWLFIALSIWTAFWLARQIAWELPTRNGSVTLALVGSSALLATGELLGLESKESFNVPSGSMKPTILVGDIVLANKWVYHWRDPQRGELVVFRLTSDPGVMFVERLIGLPGDKIQMQDGVLHINGKAVRREQEGHFVETIDNRYMEVPRYRETPPDGESYLVMELMEDGPYDNTKMYEVPPAHYFMLGDNRDNSLDSRTEFVGYVPHDHLVGMLYRRLLPVNRPYLDRR